MQERYKAEQQRQELKHKRQLDELRLSFDHTLRELEQLQNEKRKQLMEHETSKLQQLEEEHASEFKDWKSNLKPRKQVSAFGTCNRVTHTCSKSYQRLEDEFASQREEQDR